MILLDKGELGSQQVLEHGLYRLKKSARKYLKDNDFKLEDGGYYVNKDETHWIEWLEIHAH